MDDFLLSKRLSADISFLYGADEGRVAAVKQFDKLVAFLFELQRHIDDVFEKGIGHDLGNIGVRHWMYQKRWDVVALRTVITTKSLRRADVNEKQKMT